jgi:hypothetical protein
MTVIAAPPRKTAPQAVIRRCAAFWKCSHLAEYAALSKTPGALSDGLGRSFWAIFDSMRCFSIFRLGLDSFINEQNSKIWHNQKKCLTIQTNLIMYSQPHSGDGLFGKTPHLLFAAATPACVVYWGRLTF